MEIKYAIIFVLLCSHVAIEIKVDYDSEMDLVIYNGKIYIPAMKNCPEIQSQIKQKRQLFELGDEEGVDNTESTKCLEEEHVSGAEFWMYIAIIACNNL